MDQGEVWSRVLGDLEVSVSKPVFESYLRKLELVEASERKGGYRVVLGCPSAFHLIETEKKFVPMIEDALSRVTGRRGAVRLEVNTSVAEVLSEENGPLFSAKEEKRVEGVEEMMVRVGFSPELSMSNFAVSSSNEMAYAAAKAVARDPGKAYNPLFLYGGVGVGKTHLMQGVGQEILKRKTDIKVIYCSGEEFTNEIIDAIRQKSTPRFRRRYRTVGLLLIDDIQFIAGKAAVQEEFFHTFNAVTKEGGQVIMTSDKQPREIDLLEERLRSRFEGGLTIDIGQPNFELRAAIVMIKSRQLNEELPQEVAQLVAAKEDDTRAMLGMLIKMIAVARAKRVSLSVEVAKEILGAEEERVIRKKSRVTSDELIVMVADYYGADPNGVRGPKRVKSLTLPRHVAMYLLKKDLGMGLVEIGKQFNGRDHTSVMHAVDKISGLINSDAEINEALGTIRRTIYSEEVVG